MVAQRPTSQDPGAWDRWVNVLIVLALACLAAGGYLFDVAAPQAPNLLDKRWNAPVRTEWDLQTARVGAALIASCAGAVAIGLLLRFLVGRRDGGPDPKARLLMTIGIISIAATAWITWRGPFG